MSRGEARLVWVLGALLIICGTLCVPSVASSSAGSRTRNLEDSPEFTASGKVGGYRWALVISHRTTSGSLNACVAVGVSLSSEPADLERICRPLEPTPLAVGSSETDGGRQGSIVGALTSPAARTVTVKIAGREPRVVPVRLVKRGSGALGGRPFGYAVIPFLGAGCLHRLVAHDSSGMRIGKVVRGC